MNKYCFGIDLGGTSIKYGLFTIEGHLVEKWEIPTNIEDEGKHILDDIAASIRERMERDRLSDTDIKGIGIGVPGPVIDKSVVQRCVNLGWGVVDVARKLEEKTGLWTCVLNDSNAAALGEMWQGNGMGHDNLLFVTLGSGIGSGVILNGSIVEGVNGAAGEIGHMTVLKEEDIIGTCGCGRRGCLEQAASATGMVRLMQRALEAPGAKSTLADKPDLTAKDIFDAAKAGDRLAAEIADKSMFYIAKALANAVTIMNPETIVIGGGVSKAGEYLRSGIQKHFRELAFHSCQDTLIKLSTLGGNAGTYGAAKMMIDL